jgi:hypothetical protein
MTYVIAERAASHSISQISVVTAGNPVGWGYPARGAGSWSTRSWKLRSRTEIGADGSTSSSTPERLVDAIPSYRLSDVFPTKPASTDASHTTVRI